MAYLAEAKTCSICGKSVLLTEAVAQDTGGMDLSIPVHAACRDRERMVGKGAPVVGSHVWYRSYGTPGGEFPAGVPRAAIVTAVIVPGDRDSPVSLCVFNPTGLFFGLYSERGEKPGQWDWPHEQGV